MVVLAVLVAVDAPVISIIAVTILAACFSAFFGPAIGAYLPTVVGDERDLGPANSLWATLDNLAYFIGPAIAGVLIAAGGLGIRVPAQCALVRVRGAGAADPAAGTADTPAGTRRLVAPSRMPRRLRTVKVPRPGAGHARAMVGPSSWTPRPASRGMALSILLVLVAIDQLEAGPQAVGYLEAATGIGGVVAGIMAGWFVAKRLDLPLVVGGVVAACGLALLSLTSEPGRGAGGRWPWRSGPCWSWISWSRQRSSGRCRTSCGVGPWVCCR